MEKKTLIFLIPQTRVRKGGFAAEQWAVLQMVAAALGYTASCPFAQCCLQISNQGGEQRMTAMFMLHYINIVH